MYTEILWEVDKFKNQISHLRKMALNYPEIYIEEAGNCTWASTMVKFTYEEKEYLRHHVDSFIKTPTADINKLLKRIHHAAKQCMECAIPIGSDYFIVPKH